MSKEKREELTNRALARGLMVVRILDKAGGCRLADLMRLTGLPKTTLRRLLAVLLDQRFIRRSMGDGRYRANVSWTSHPLQNGMTDLSEFLDIACDVMRDLTARVQWPSDILLRNGNHMQVIESTRSVSPLFVAPGKLEVGVDMIRSAAGPAYLAYCPAKEREEILAGLGIAGALRSRFDGVLAEIRKRGYALRDPDYWGDSVANDRLRAIAMAIPGRQGIAGVINLVWTAGMIDEDMFAARHAEDLRMAVNTISERYCSLVKA
ncbi:helix-turn-helix domain-containing protein [Thalassospira australica]|uniref:helix-turn-helix domain-containing protein n=1 Tax=Thalassospira australica TaxID=1528106 RepID=UPI00384A687B